MTSIGVIKMIDNHIPTTRLREEKRKVSEYKVYPFNITMLYFYAED